MQILINEAIIKVNWKLNSISQLNFSMQANPYPPFEDDKNFVNLFVTVIPSLISFGYISLAVNVIPRIVEEKESGSREWMRLIGLSSINLWLSWIFFSMMIFIFTSIIMSVVLVVNIGGYTVLATVNVVILWLLIFLFCINSSVYILTISTVFSNPSLATVIACFFWVAPSTIISKFDFNSFPFVGKLFTCLFPSMSLEWAFSAISGYEASNAALSFSSLFKLHTGETAEMTIGVIYLCQISTSILYFLVLLYLDSIFPGKYGRKRPWHFIFTGILKKINKKPMSMNAEESNIKNEALYETFDHLPVGLKVCNLKKYFGNFAAVDDVSLDIYKGQITALLGHNGAGKTTLINILTGMYTATCGGVYKDGKNVFDDFRKFQRTLGLCPQHDLLFPYLSASEHVLFFGMMRGLSKSVVAAECKELFELFGISHKYSELPKNLSGGMKRKVCLSVALVGNPEIIVLDEPTSGMDPESRRETWNKLLGLRGHRIILLTTHYMEEADVLGDIIAIMDHGKVKCYGSSMFLKKHYGEGYQLKVRFCGELSEISNVISHYVPEATKKEESVQCATFCLPTSRISIFPELFKKLESLSNVSNLSVACTTMEDVFMKVEHSAYDEVDNIVMEQPLLSDKYYEDRIHGSNDALTPQPVEGFELLVSRFIALIVKKWLYNIRSWSTYIFTVILWPFMMTALAAYVSSVFAHLQDIPPPLKLLLNFYGSTNVLMSGSNSSSLFINYKSLISSEDGTPKILKSNESMIDEYLHVAETELLDYRSTFIVGIDLLTSMPNLFYSTIAYHSPPISLNLFYNAWLATNNISQKIITENYPLDLSKNECSSIYNAVFAAVPPSIFWLFIFPSTLLSMCCSFCKLPHDERVKSGKLLQFMTGTPPLLYWLSAFIVDFGFLLFGSGIILLSIRIFDYSHLFAISSNYGVFFVYILLTGISGTWFSYLMSFFFNTYASVHSAQVFFVIILGQIGCLIIYLLRSFIATEGAGHVVVTGIHYILLLYPGYSACSALRKIILYFSLSYYSQLCQFTLNPEMNLYSWDENYGIYSEILYMEISWISFLSLILLAEIGFLSYVSNYIYSSFIGPMPYFDDSTQDIYVKQEKQQVLASKNSGYLGQDVCFLSDGIGKKYNRRIIGVKDVSFNVRKGECFGLLGVNGAGKSTTFKMLSGDIMPSKGDAILFQNRLTANKLQYQSFIGYCPQFDAIIENLTGLEMLNLYAALRGVNPSVRASTLATWISEFGLQKYCKKYCGNYSGGNKRKLSTAIALIGEPKVVFLDEPTTGVDPVARRKFWAILSYLQKRGQTVIITSHSMDECEKVCDRLTIMAQGEMKCIGTIPELKSRYGQGFTIMIKVSKVLDDELLRIKNAVRDTFDPHCILRDEHIGLLHYHIKNNEFQWSTLFLFMEKIKTSYPAVEDYVITETSLEQVFLFFAKQSSVSGTTDC